MYTETNLINDKLSELRLKDNELRNDGAIFHKYQLNQTLSEKQLLQFEESFGIELPLQYRSFLNSVGNGGAGPDFGLNSLEQAVIDCDLSKPFHWTDNVDESDDEVSEMLENSHYTGLLQMSVENYAFPIFLVVNGATAGNIWFTTNCNEFIKGPTFFKWYIDWLDESLKAVKS